MRKGLIVLFLLLVIAFGVIGLQQDNGSHNSHTETEQISLFSNK